MFTVKAAARRICGTSAFCNRIVPTCCAIDVYCVLESTFNNLNIVEAVLNMQFTWRA